MQEQKKPDTMVVLYRQGTEVLKPDFVLDERMTEVITYAIDQNNPVGAVTGYYDEDLSIATASRTFPIP